MTKTDHVGQEIKPICGGPCSTEGPVRPSARSKQYQQQTTIK